MKLDSSASVEAKIRHLTENTGTVPSDDLGFLLDIGLARAATEIAVERHAGRLEQVYSPYGVSLIQTGKDLTDVNTVRRGEFSLMAGSPFLSWGEPSFLNGNPSH
jgi:hypothetical protein